MQALNALSVAAAIGRRMGAEVKKGVRAVNPDVWREFAVVSTLAYTLAIPKREKIEDRAPDGYPPLILVHGLGGNRGGWTPLRWYLRMNGRRRIYAFGFEKGKLEDVAVKLNEFIQEVLLVTGEKEVDIIAHSLGGLISRYAIQNLGLDKCVGTFVAIATPHQGTYAAQYANTDKILAMRPDAEFIRKLNALKFPVGIRFMTVGSDRDIYVIPFDSMTHPDAKNVFIPGLSHSQHLMSCKVFRAVMRFLDAPHACFDGVEREPACETAGE
jgi:triacylglycerol lipase